MRLSHAGLAVLSTAVTLLAAPGSAAADPLSTLRCGGHLAPDGPAPVLLIHGTGVTAEENWAWGYEKAMLDRGHGVCTIDLPTRGTVDLQESVPVTVAAIGEVSRRAGGRRIAIIGHSQGAAQAVFALRFRPQLASIVDDVIGLAGVYDGGSAAIAERCSEECIPPFWQFKPGSRFLQSLATRPPPPGPSITAIGTLHDTVVTPQPQANAVAGGTSIQIQDVCPERRFVPAWDHVHLAADAVAYALAVDALDHPGPADPKRISPVNCALDVYPEADPVRLATLGPKLIASFRGEGQGPTAKRESQLRCPFAAGCDVLAAFRPAQRLVTSGGRLLLRVRVARAGRVRLRFASGPTRSAPVQPGQPEVRIRLPALRSGRHTAGVEAQSVPGSAWTPVGRIALRVAPALG